MDNWPDPIRTLRDYLPKEIRILRGIMGALGGTILVFEIFVLLLGGNWQLGYTHDRIFGSVDRTDRRHFKQEIGERAILVKPGGDVCSVP